MFHQEKFCRANNGSFIFTNAKQLSLTFSDVAYNIVNHDSFLTFLSNFNEIESLFLNKLFLAIGQNEATSLPVSNDQIRDLWPNLQRINIDEVGESAAALSQQMIYALGCQLESITLRNMRGGYQTFIPRTFPKLKAICVDAQAFRCFEQAKNLETVKILWNSSVNSEDETKVIELVLSLLQFAHTSALNPIIWIRFRRL